MSQPTKYRITKQMLQEHFAPNAPPSKKLPEKAILDCDVFIAGSGPIGATFARKILDWGKETGRNPQIIMADIGSKDGEITGGHHKNSIKFQKDIDLFVNVIKGALQPVSVSPAQTFLPTVNGTGWTAPPAGAGAQLIIQGNNPNQAVENNLAAAAVTRTVGGMATHWTCACPIPHDEERQLLHEVIPKSVLDPLLDHAGELLNVHEHEYDHSIRHNLVRKGLEEAMAEYTNPPREFKNIPLAVQRRTDNPDYVTWSSAATILGEWIDKFPLLTETRVTSVGRTEAGSPRVVEYAVVRDLNTNQDRLITAKAFVLACGSLPTPQILFNSGITPPHLGCYLTEQSMAFCQVLLKKEFIDSVPLDDPRVVEHKRKHPNDPLPIPFNDPEPQLMIPYSSEFPWHVQVHRDAFSYGDVGPKADPRVVVDLRFFGKGEIRKENRIHLGSIMTKAGDWQAGVTDIYGMPQITFDITRSEEDNKRDQRMMRDMTNVANHLGSYLPGSEPQFMTAGLALHTTGTTRIGNDPDTSIADSKSRVHGFDNLWVGGNGNLPDATGSNPTRTSVAIALHAMDSLFSYLENYPGTA